MSRATEPPLRALSERKALNSRLQKEGRLQNVESCLNRTDGHLVWVLEDAVLVPGEHGNPPVAERIFIDVTERHRLYDEIRRARRRESVNRLTTATVQDFTDLLTSMMGYGELLLDGLEPHDPRRRQAERIREVACKAGELARQFVASTLKEETRQEALDLNTVIKGAEMLIRQLIGEDIEFLVKLTPGPALVSALRQEIEQLLTTLLVNVRDALPVGGTLSVETALAAQGPGAKKGPCVLVAVRGAGYGAQPVQTTSSLDSIVAGLGGVLQAGADPQSGAYYELYLPAGEQDASCPDRQDGDLMRISTKNYT
jgi:signal transduction histidine kinase